MDVLFVDVDRAVDTVPLWCPNLAIMQASGAHKAQGDNVGFDIEDPDIVYASIVFSKNKHIADGLQFKYPNAEILIGGSGSGDMSWLTEEMQKAYPDYDLYPSYPSGPYSLGFTTRGCIRRCPFCIVYQKEGKYRRWQHIKEFHNPEYKNVVILDNNWYADKDWFFENSQYVIDNDLALNVSQGMDLRILTPEIAEQLKKIRWFKSIKFAWDNIHDEKEIMEGLQMLQDAGIALRSNVMVYVLTDFDTTLEQDIYRVNKLKHTHFEGQRGKGGTNAYVMQYQQIDETFKKPLGNTHVPYMARWSNNKWLFWSHDFVDYENGKWMALSKRNTGVF